MLAAVVLCTLAGGPVGGLDAGFFFPFTGAGVGVPGISFILRSAEANMFRRRSLFSARYWRAVEPVLGVLGDEEDIVVEMSKFEEQDADMWRAGRGCEVAGVWNGE